MPEEFTVNQEVVILPGGWGRPVKPIPARIVKVARVWMDVESIGSGFPNRWRIRKDTQDEGNTGTLVDARLYTLAQWAERERKMDANAFLAEQGIRLNVDSVWAGREAKLADLIRKASTDGQE